MAEKTEREAKLGLVGRKRESGTIKKEGPATIHVLLPASPRPLPRGRKAKLRTDSQTNVSVKEIRKIQVCFFSTDKIFFLAQSH